MGSRNKSLRVKNRGSGKSIDQLCKARIRNDLGDQYDRLDKSEKKTPKLEFDLLDGYPELDYERQKNPSSFYKVFERFIHRGQRKLFMGELEHLVEYLDDKMEIAYVVYIGSSPNNKALRHLRYFPNVKYIFIDPNMCNMITDKGKSHYFRDYPDKTQELVVYLKYSNDTTATLAGRGFAEKGIQFFDGTKVVIVPNKFSAKPKSDFMEHQDETIDFIINSDHRIFVVEDYFGGDTAVFIRKLFDQIPDHKKILWSDMRSGNDSNGIMIDHVRIYNWSRVVLPDFAMFKFRCPFDLNIDYAKHQAEYDEAKERGLDLTNIGDTLPYFKGRIMTQCWQKRDSAETRLFVSGDDIQNNVIFDYDRLTFERQNCYYNELDRVSLLHENEYASPKSGLGECGDCAIEGSIWGKYKAKFDPEIDVTEEVIDLSRLTETRNMTPLTNNIHYPV